MDIRRALVWVSSVVVLLVAQPVLSADIEAKLVIDEVTVYPQSANVTRAGKVSIPAGDHRLIIRGLPDPLDPSSLRVSAGSTAVRLGGVEVQKVIDRDYVSESERALRRRLITLQDQRVALQDDIPTAESQLKLIDSLAALPTDRNGKAAIEGLSIQSTLTTIATGSDAARAKIRAANIAIRNLDDEIAAVKAELAKIATARKTTTEVRTTIVASADVTVPISVEYRVGDAGWEWLYEARLDTQEKRMTLLRQAAIRQGSGEDWSNAEVSVTTARPRGNAGTPSIESMFLRLSDYAPPSSGGSLEEIVVTGSRIRGKSRARSNATAEEDVQEAPLITTEEFATEFVQDFRIPSRVSIAADRQVRVYPVSEESFNTDLVARAVMSVDPTARLEAKFNYAKETPIEAGRLQLYRDGAYVGSASLPLLLPGSDVRVPFGVDERIRIVVRDEKAESGRRGVLSRQMLSEHRRRYEITSYHAAAFPIEVIDRVPVPKDSGIKVEVLEGATPPTTKDFDGKAGVYLWRLAGTPKKTETIRHLYSVRYPGDKVLAFSQSTD
jgi:uncharacterized protein (TIGR02231 family)